MLIDLSEKYTVYKLLELMIEEFRDSETGEDERKPFLGSGDDSFMPEVMERWGGIPAANTCIESLLLPDRNYGGAQVIAC